MEEFDRLTGGCALAHALGNLRRFAALLPPIRGQPRIFVCAFGQPSKSASCAQKCGAGIFILPNKLLPLARKAALPPKGEAPPLASHAALAYEYAKQERAMSHITLIRHGQANTGARTEGDYDRLSPLGQQQSTWLGAHLRASASHHPRIFCGTLKRHVQTVEAMGHGAEAIRDPRLNELEYFTLSRLLETQTGLELPTEREGFVTHLPKVFSAWHKGDITNPPESFAAFDARVSQALQEIAQGQGPALVITSGGLISMAMRQVLGLDTPAMAQMALAIMNTSMHRLYPIGGLLSPVLFNAVPHLETPDRHHAQTHF